MNNVDTQNQHESTLQQLLGLRFIIQTLLECQPKRMKLLDELESIENSLSVLRVKEYLNLNENDNDSLLNLGDYCNNITLSYTAQKAIREELMRSLRNRLVLITKFIEKMKLDLPYLFETQKPTEGNISTSCKELLNLEAQRRETMQTLVEMKNQKLRLMKAALELKLGPHVCNELEILNAEMRFNQTKANLMYKYIIREFVTRSDHSVKAIKMVEGYIDKKLDEQNGEEKNEKV